MTNKVEDHPRKAAPRLGKGRKSVSDRCRWKKRIRAKGAVALQAMGCVFIGGRRGLRERASTRSWHAHRETRESINDVGTLLVQLGEQLERGEGKSERESVRLRAFARASIKASAAGRSVHFSRAFETGNPADSKPVLVRDFENRVLSGRLIACIRKIIKKEKRKRIEENCENFFFFRNDSLVMDH